MPNSKRQIELDYVRALSMLGVIVIHVTSTFVYASSNLTVAGMNPAFLLNQLVRFSVPLFILLSGVSLGFSRSADTYLSFFRKRCVKIVLPYLFWSCAYWLYYHRGEGLARLGSALLRGGAASHLYFIVIVIQLYLLYPFLRRLVKRHPFPTLIFALLISFIAQQAILDAAAGLIPRGPILQNLWFLFPTWLFYFVLGMVVGHFNVSRLCGWCGRHLWFLLTAALLFGGLYAYKSHLSGNLDSIKISLFLYTPLVFLTLLALGNRLQKQHNLTRGISFLAVHSQTVFFMHLFVLAFLRKVPLLITGTRGMLLLLLTETVLSVLIAWFIDFVLIQLKKIKH